MKVIKLNEMPLEQSLLEQVIYSRINEHECNIELRQYGVSSGYPDEEIIQCLYSILGETMFNRECV